jgi:CAAX prenyl protease-like protein
VHSKGIASVTNPRGVNSAFYRYLPFALFMGFIGLEEFIGLLVGLGLINSELTTLYYLYPIKALTIGCLLYRFRKHYHELSVKDFANIPATLSAVGAGLLVFALWIRMDWSLGVAGGPQGFNPTLLSGQTTQVAMTFFRIAGTVLVVPLMEELFWRSFLIRYIIDKNFDSISMGTFTWTSFLLTVVLFGLEHNFILAGIMAGVFYNIVLYKTRSLAQCVLSHAVTNLALALYVVSTGKWHFW